MAVARKIKRVVKSEGSAKEPDMTPERIGEMSAGERDEYLESLATELLMWDQTKKSVEASLEQSRSDLLVAMRMVDTTSMTVTDDKGQVKRVTAVSPQSKTYDDAEMLDLMDGPERAALTKHEFDIERFKSLSSSGAIPDVYLRMAEVEVVDIAAVEKKMAVDPPFATKLSPALKITDKKPYLRISNYKDSE